MQRLLSIAIAMLLCGTLSAQATLVKVSSSLGQTSFKIAIDGGYIQEIRQGDTAFASWQIAGCYGGSVVGAPNLPTWRRVVEVPLCKEVRVSIVSAKYDTIEAASMGIYLPIMPLQPSRHKSDTSAHSFVLHPQYYATDHFYAQPTVSIEPIGVARNSNLATLIVSPFQYNAVRQQLVICRQVEVALEYVDIDLAATHRLKQLHHSPSFSLGVPVQSLLAEEKGLNTTTPVRMLIVSHHTFRGELDAFVQWKRRTGLLVDVAYTDSIGTTAAAIKRYIVSQYTNADLTGFPAPTYLLLVGDVAQIPPHSGRTTMGVGHVTDLYYALWTSGDDIPDCYYSRLSASTKEELRPQLQKTLMYEQYTFPDPSFLDHAVLVAGEDQGYSTDYGYMNGDPTMDYVATNYVNGNHGFSQVKYYKNNFAIDPHALNVTVGSNRNAATVANSYNEGAGWINYTAHGDWNEWSIPSFTVRNVANMTNAYRFGFMMGNCCLTGMFDRETCFAEALLRLDGYRGAVAYIGASDYTYWNEDVYWSIGYRSAIRPQMSLAYNSTHLGSYDRLFHTHGEPLAERQTTVGGIVYAGNMSVQSTNSTLKKYYWEVYHAFGDPSLQPWLGRAKKPSVMYDSVIAQKGEKMQVVAPAGAYVALTSGSNAYRLVAGSYANDNGVATLSYPDTLAFGLYELAITGQNLVPQFRTVRVAEHGLNVVNTILYPMPATQYVNVECDTTIHALALYNLMGRMLMQQEVGTKKTIVDLHSYPHGNYLLRLDTPVGIITKKILIQAH